MSHDFSELQMGLQNNFNTCIISIITKPVSWCIHTLPWCPLASVCCLIEAGRNRKRTAAMSNQATIIIIRVELEPSVAASGCNPNAKHNKSSHIMLNTTNLHTYYTRIGYGYKNSHLNSSL